MSEQLELPALSAKITADPSPLRADLAAGIAETRSFKRAFESTLADLGKNVSGGAATAARGLGDHLKDVTAMRDLGKTLGGAGGGAGGGFTVNVDTSEIQRSFSGALGDAKDFRSRFEATLDDLGRNAGASMRRNLTIPSGVPDRMAQEEIARDLMVANRIRQTRTQLARDLDGIGGQIPLDPIREARDRFRATAKEINNASTATAG
jgi:hypothetical protein